MVSQASVARAPLFEAHATQPQHSGRPEWGSACETSCWTVSPAAELCSRSRGGKTHDDAELLFRERADRILMSRIDLTVLCASQASRRPATLRRSDAPTAAESGERSHPLSGNVAPQRARLHECAPRDPRVDAEEWPAHSRATGCPYRYACGAIEESLSQYAFRSRVVLDRCARREAGSAESAR
jgi:hypothetical protein